MSSAASDVADHPDRRSGHRHRALLAAVAAVALTAISCSSSEGASPDALPVATSPIRQAAGIPVGFKDGIAEGKARYPNIGSTGRGDTSWACPLVDAVEVDGRTMDEVLTTTFARLDTGIHEITCDFFPPTPVDLRFALADDQSAYDKLVESTGAFRQPGNVQVEDEVTIDGRTFVAVTWTYPTNPKAGTRYVACFLDEALRGRACLDVADSDERSADYDARQAAEELSAILSG